jgi:protein involved in sex pheromone biosynthesis
MRKLIGLAAVAVVLVLSGCTESFQREMKTVVSEYTGGLERTAKVYAGNGELIASYEGKFDVQSSEYGNKVLFDIDGKRVIIYNAVVIVEEF